MSILNKRKPTISKDKYYSNLDRKVELIMNELDIIDPQNLLIHSDPSNNDATETITQIQHYFYLLKEEAKELKNYQFSELHLEDIKHRKQKEFQELVRPKNDLVYWYEDKYEEREQDFIKNKEQRKPVLDYKVKVRELENEISNISQNINYTKAKNDLMKKDLDKLRENVITNSKKVDIVESELIKQEREFNNMKAEVDDIHKNAQNDRKIKPNDKILERIHEDKNRLETKNKDIIELVKKADKDITQKFAKIKYYDHEKVKIEKEENKIIRKWEKELKNFKKEKKEDIEKYNNYDPSSKILDFVNSDESKRNSLEEILRKMCEQTNLDDIYQLVNFFINCTKEVKAY
jgi:chromosome segregation ATPase